jgi:hypothetical protein
MSHATVHSLSFGVLAAFGLGISMSVGSFAGHGQDSPPAGPQAPENKAAARSDRGSGPWRALGRVTDQNGRPLAGVEVSAHCGAGTLRRSGVATSGDDGRYDLSFGPGVFFPSDDGTAVQAATITAHKSGCFEENLNRQGDCLAAEKQPGEDAIKSWGNRKARVFLPDRPVELNFVMRPAARVGGKLIDERGQPLVGYSVALNGPDLPPSSSVMCAVQTDERGPLSLENIPTSYRFQFEVRQANPKPPWDDSWASAALRFDQPDKDDLRAWFGNREIRLEELVIRVVGPGVHGRSATPIAGNAGVLNLTARDPQEVHEQSDQRLVAKSAVLTLRNSSHQGLSQSLVTESVPVALAHESKTRLARTRPNDAGEFTISFENPPGYELAPGKHQVIFQVFVGASQKPIREKIFRQLEIRRDGRYEVPVKIRPEWIDDSIVSITFVSIQPNHDAWVRSFFHDGKGTSYQGLWAGDGGLLPAIAFDTRKSE